MGRSSKKGPYIDPKLYEKIERINRTGEDWSGYNTWGQLAVDWMELRGNGKP